MTTQEAKQRLERIWKDYTSAYDTASIEDLMAFDMATNALGAIEQIQWERDLAIKQLHDLGYGLGEKVKKSNDLIERQKAIDGLEGYIDDKGIFNQDRWFVHGIRTAITHLMGMPSTEPEPKTGEWNFDGNQMYECTNCGVAYTEYQFEKMRVRYDDPKFPKFCPDCGSYNGGDSDDQQ